VGGRCSIPFSSSNNNNSNINNTSSKYTFPLMVLQVSYELDDPQGGFEVSWPDGGGALMHAGGGGGCGSTSGVDLDGARCRWPCLDGPAGRHQAPVELAVSCDAAHACVASGQQLRGGAAHEAARGAVPPWVSARVSGQAPALAATAAAAPPCPPPPPLPSAFCEHAWFVGPHCPLRGVGLVLGSALQQLPPPPPPQPPLPGLPPSPLRAWVCRRGDASDAGHASCGLDAASLFCGDVLGTGGPFPEPGHTQVAREELVCQ
jgi:hypothetical protein